MKKMILNILLFLLPFSALVPVHAESISPLKDSFNQNTVRNGWSSDGQMYYENGKYVTGQKKIDGFWYYFDEKTGKMVHGWKYIASQKKTVWYGQETGHMLYGEVRINMKWYYLNDKTGAVTYGWKQIKSNKKTITVYYDKNGWKVFGKQTINGKSYEFDKTTGALIKGTDPFASSASAAVTNGWNKAKDMYYVNGKYVTGQKKIDGYWYYFDDKTGKMVHGWKYIANQKKTVWYGQDTGRMLYGQVRINGYWYYLNDKTGAVTYGWKFIEKQNKTVYYDTEGKMVHGQKKIDGYWYYFDDSTGAKITGWKEIKSQNKTVYYNEEGKMLYGIQTIDGKKYEFNTKTGALIGEVKESLGSTNPAVQNGWSEDKQMYYRDGEYVTGQRLIDGYYYYFDEKTGKMVHGWKYIESQDKTVWYGQETGRMLYGEQRINGHYYYLNKNSGAVTYGWKTLNGKNLYYDANGWKAFGMQMVDGKWHEFDMSTGNHIGAAGGWKWQSGKLVFYNSRGLTCKGKMNINSVPYTFNSSTGAVENRDAVTSVFDAHTNAIINAHRYDFDSTNLKSILKSYGGYDQYVKSLGGVFTKYYAKDKYSITTISEFQEIGKYVWGLLTIYGFNYYDAVYGKSNCWGGAYPADDAFYTSSSPIAAIKGKKNSEKAFIDDVLAGNTAAGMQVNCSQGITYIFRKAGLIPDDAPTIESEFYYYKTGDSKEWTHYYRNMGAEIITDAKNLKVGDVIAYFTGTSYKHVALVMYVDKTAGMYTLYDSGHILTSSRKGIRTLKIGTSPLTLFYSYDSWAAIRLPLDLK